MRILLTDIVFPNKYAAWRLNSVKKLQNVSELDILVPNRVEGYAGITYSFDYNELKEKYNLDKYDLLIFNPKYNILNNIVNSDFDGTKYNGILPYSYMLRLKKYRNYDLEIDFDVYDFLYHNFYMCYNTFNNFCIFPFNKQILHLYPGGGFLRARTAHLNFTPITVDENVLIIPTQQPTIEYLETNHKSNKIYTIYGGYFMLEDEVLRKKPINNGVITVCFTCIGDIIPKGGNIYLEMIKMYKQKYGNSNINFISIGVQISEEIKYYKPMPQNELDDFYYNNVDIYINFDGNLDTPAFPHGLEAVKQGCVLLTTDIHDLNKKNKFNFNNFFIISSLEECCEKIYILDTNREDLVKYSNIIQDDFYRCLNPHNQTQTLKTILGIV